MENPKLALIPSGYKSGKVYCILPNNATGDFDFDRASEGTRVRKDGLIEEVTNDVPRLDWLNSSCPSLKLEPQRTNLQVRSEEFDVTWIKLNSSISANDTISPNGELTADKFIANTVNTSHYVQSYSTVSTSSEVTFSIFVKKGEISQLQLLCAQSTPPLTNWARLHFDLNTLTEFSSNIGTFGYEDYGNGWLRIFITGTPTSTTALIRVTLYKNFSNAFVGNDSDGFYLFGAQVEQGSYPTSYIKTQASTVTRLKDTCTLLNQTLFTNYPFTVYAKAKVEELGGIAFSLVDSVASNKYLSIQFSSSFSQIGVLRRDASNNDSDYYTYSYSVGDTLKIAIAFIDDTSYKLYINGTEIADVTSGLSIPFDHNDICLGQFRIASDTGARNGIDDFRVYDYTLTDTQLTELTTL